MTEPADATVPDVLSARVIARDLVVALLIVVAAVIAIGWAFAPYVEAASLWFVGKFGLLGVFVGTAIVDTFPGGFNGPFLVLGYSGGLGFVPVWLSASAGSMLAGFNGYAIGRVIGRTRVLQALLERYRLPELMKRYGPTAIVVAAVTPIPYAIVTWGAGATQVPLKYVFIAALLRVPRLALYVAAGAIGWEAAT